MSSFSSIFILKLSNYIKKLCWKIVHCLLSQLVRHTEISFCNTACNTSNGITVTSYRYCVSYRILKVLTIEECDYGLRNTILAYSSPSISRPNFITGELEVVSKAFFYLRTNLLFSISLPCLLYTSDAADD